jgi:hypothetical protein
MSGQHSSWRTVGPFYDNIRSAVVLAYAYVNEIIASWSSDTQQNIGPPEARNPSWSMAHVLQAPMSGLLVFLFTLLSSRKLPQMLQACSLYKSTINHNP